MSYLLQHAKRRPSWLAVATRRPPRRADVPQPAGVRRRRLRACVRRGHAGRACDADPRAAAAAADRRLQQRDLPGVRRRPPSSRENSLHKIDTLLGALHRFRAGLVAEADLYAERERVRDTDNRKEARCAT